MITKEESIARQLAKPIEVGDSVDIKIPYLVSVRIGGTKKEPKYTEETHYKTGSGTVNRIIQGGTVLLINDTHIGHLAKTVADDKIIDLPSNHYHISWATQSISHCGANPFQPSPRIDFLNITIESLFYYCGVGKRSEDWSNDVTEVNSGKPEVIGKTYGGVNFDPYVIDKDGNRQYYQRGLVWDDDQKRLLIDSIYGGIEIGKFVFREKTWEQLEREMIENGHGYNFDCVDGKQRLHALIGFVRDKFTDSHGNYFSDLSRNAQRNFLGYGKFAFGKLDEKASDQDVLNAFLYVNFTGVPMSKDHIDFVKSIKV